MLGVYHVRVFYLHSALANVFHLNINEDKKINQERNSTVAISAIDSKKLDQFCKNNALSKKEFIYVSLAYFIREGINPKTHESPKGEFTKINKRIDQLFSFIKKQEQDLLKPLILDVIKAQNSQFDSFKLVNENQAKLQKTVLNESQSISTEVKKVSKDSKDQNDKIIYTQGDLKKSLEVLAQFMDEKNKKGLLGKLFTK